MTMYARGGGLLAAFLTVGCSMTEALSPSGSVSGTQAAQSVAQEPLPYFPPECANPTQEARSTIGLSDPGVYHALCRTGWDGRVTSLAFSALLGGEDSNATASFRFTGSVLSQRSRDIISFPQLVKPSHFEPIPWNSATDGPRNTELPGIKGEFRLLGRETVAFTPPGATKSESCVEVSFTLPPQDTPLGRIGGATTRLLRCASDQVYRLPAFGS